ncbi:hypothetical protein MPC4_20273 [Methylocella tundrae]|uniref:Uncharacterized protein n=1 Tax=Methylocella tundrae TaxID=227605 RepID=A0A8B6M6V2_METTU|nr:hypothetical protein MPC1_1600003 [Methylocella tundrae]VTZ50063.1 hypothetical protein MPC4_20273 [Methylocella tundrae]
MKLVNWGAENNSAHPAATIMNPTHVSLSKIIVSPFPAHKRSPTDSARCDARSRAR